LPVRGSHSEAVLGWVHFVAVASASADLRRILLALLKRPESGLERLGAVSTEKKQGALVVFVQQYLRARLGVAGRWSTSTCALFRKPESE
jgi:hypothetical protein